MKFEHVLQIYWTKGFFFGGQLFYFNESYYSLPTYTNGLNKNFYFKLLQRFELTRLQPNQLLKNYEIASFKNIINPLNIIFSQIHTVNNQMYDLNRLIIIRMYLIRSYRGRCHAIGKPVKGQRTWSNAWSSYKNNKILRSFIYETTFQLQQKKPTEKINYKIVKKNTRRSKK